MDHEFDTVKTTKSVPPRNPSLDEAINVLQNKRVAREFPDSVSLSLCSTVD